VHGTEPKGYRRPVICKILSGRLAETMNETKPIKCPECGAIADLHRFPGKFAGIWECDNCGSSEACDHDETETIETTNTVLEAGEPVEYNTTIEVCLDCGVPVEKLTNGMYYAEDDE
jgi:ribosomal protein L37AE/L43A